jgi:hypothetical protein
MTTHADSNSGRSAVNNNNVSAAHSEITVRDELRSARLLGHHVRDILARCDIREPDNLMLNALLKETNLASHMFHSLVIQVIASSNCQCRCVVYPHNSALSIRSVTLVKLEIMK